MSKPSTVPEVLGLWEALEQRFQREMRNKGAPAETPTPNPLSPNRKPKTAKT